MKKEIPLYLFICRKIEDDIYNGKLKLGDALPSEPKISKQMGASRNSVRKALRLLQDNNLIFCSHGKNAQVIFDSRLPEHREAYEKRFETGVTASVIHTGCSLFFYPAPSHTALPNAAVKIS